MIDVAGVRVELRGDDPVANLVRHELAVPGDHAGTPTGLVDVRTGPPPPLSDAVGLGAVELTDDIARLRFERSGLTLDVPLVSAATPWRVEVAVEDRPTPFGLPRRLFRWAEPTFLSPVEAQAYAFVHLVVESAVLIHQLDVAPLHAAVVAREGRSFVLASAGGVGKTTTAMALVRSGRWRFLSDDMTVVAPGAPVAPYQRRCMVYEYNLCAEPALRSAVPPPGDRAGRIQWQLTGPVHRTGRRRRIHPDDLFGRRVLADPAPLGVVAFLVRGPGPDVGVRELEAEELAARCVAVLRGEFSHLVERLELVRAAGGPDLVTPTFARMHGLYRRTFERADRLVELALPPGGDPERTVDVVERLARG